MAVHECISLKFMDSCDDDGHVFRSSSSKQNQAESPMKSQSQTTGQSPGKALSQQLPNGENTYSRRNKNISSTNSVAAKHSLTSEINLHDRLAAFVNKPHAETSNSDAPIAKHTPSHKSNLIDKQHAFVNSHSEAANSDDSDDNKPLRFKKTASTSKTSGSLPLSVADDNCDDDKPLSSGSVINSSRVHGSLQTKIPSNPQKTALKNKDGSSVAKDQKSSKLLVRPNVLPDSNELSDSDEKPLLDRFKQNGSSKSEPGTSGKAMPNSKKRSSIGDSNSHLSSKKKTKLSEVSVNDVKKKPVLKELKASKADKDDYDDDDDGDDDGGDDDDYVPIMQRVKKTVSPKNRSSAKKSLKKINKTSFKKKSKESKKDAKKYKEWKLSKVPPGSGEGQKWTTLEHNGVIFPTPYKPHGIKMLYNGQPVDLSPEQEEVATMFAVMKDTEYATKTAFIANFMNDWRAILGKNHVVKKFELCDFTPIYEWHSREKEKKKQMTSEEKKALKEEKMRIEEKYMWAIVDGVKEKVGNFRVEPPGLFRGRGEHPKMGKLKKRIRPQDITINIGKDAPIPECPISGERWKEVRHDNTVTWLAYWNDPINSKELKYVFLAASSSLKGQSDKEKYEKARKLKDYILSIRARYTKDLASKDDTRRQIAVATYLIDKLALRAGNEKDDDEADTVGCCTLKVEHVTLVPPNKLQFDFLGKDSIRYFNTVEVDPPVYKAIGEFQKGGKKGADDLFDKLDTAKLNAHLKELMPGLTAKVFRTYNASITLDDMLNGKTKGDNVPEKIAVYQSANKEVAIICNHQRSVSKNHDTQMSRLDEKIDELKSQQKELEVDLGRAKKGKPPLNDADGKPKRNLAPEAIQRKLAQLATKIEKMELDRKIKEDLKTVALGTSKINYLDPRISVAWCKRNEVPIEKIFNKSLLAKFAWAMDVEPSFRF